MGLFRRRRETLNEKLLRDAGLDPAQALGDSPPPGPVEPPKSLYSRLGIPDGSGVGPRKWDCAVTASVPGLAGDEVEFATLPNGDVIIGEETGDTDLSPLADAVERHLDPPYRAVAQRQGGDTWAVGARRIDVAQIPFPAGDKLDLTQNRGHEELRVDGEPSEEPVPRQLELLGGAFGDDFYVEAERIDGDLWEVRATGL